MMQIEAFPKDYWSPPKIDSQRQGDKEAGRIYFAVGNATTMWETVEDSILFLLRVLSKSQDTQSHTVITRMFGVIESSSSRLKMLETVAEIYYGHYWARDEIRKPFRFLMDNISKASWRRNEFAHGKVISFQTVTNDDEKGAITLDHGAFLVAPDYMIGRQKSLYATWDADDPLIMVKSNYRYTSGDIMEFVQKFNALHGAVIMFAERCRIKEGSLPEDVLKLLANDIEADAIKKARRVRPKDRN